jgi:uncharacterized protein
MEEKPWYSCGVKFKCKGCGKCCTGFPGYVWVNDEEIQAIGKFFGVSVDEVKKQYLRRAGGAWALREMPRNYDCVFLKGRRCEIYQVRPHQCRTFPWWKSVLASKEAWDETARYCEGMGPDAPLVPFDEIESHVQK